MHAYRLGWAMLIELELNVQQYFPHPFIGHPSHHVTWPMQMSLHYQSRVSGFPQFS